MTRKRTGITAPRGALCAAAAAVLVGTLLCVAADAAAQTAPAKPAARKDVVRTLDAINIEGEIAVPQVLFITARDVRRYRDGLGLKFQLSATDAGRAAVLPARLHVAPPSVSHKEEGR
jgi:hypothetical protein